MSDDDTGPTTAPTTLHVKPEGAGPETEQATPIGTGPDHEPDDTAEVSARDFFARVYQVTYSKTIGLALILAMAVAVLVGVVIAQAPPGVWDDPASREQYLTQMTNKYGGWTKLLSVLGCFHMFTSLGFYMITAALAVSILGCTIHRIPQLWARYRHPRIAVSDRFFICARYAASVSMPLSDEETIAVARERLTADHYRVIAGDDSCLYADKYAWGGFGTVLAHLSFILILVAFAVSGATGREIALTVPVGGTAVSLGEGTAVTIQATSFNASFDPATGQPLDYVSHVIIADGGTPVTEQDLRVNTPVRYGGWSFHQNSYGLSVDVTVTDGQSTVLFTGSVPQQWTSNDGTLSVGRFALPARSLTVDVVASASGAVSADLAPGQVAFLIYRDGESEAMGMTIVDQGTSGSVGDLNVGFDRESQYTSIMARKDPGAIWMWTGSVLLVVGMTVTFTCRHRRVWIRAQGGTLLFASADKEDSGFRRNFTDLVSQAESWHTTSPTPHTSSTVNDSHTA